MKKLEKCRIGFIGAGNMAEAIVKGLLDRSTVAHAQLVVSDPSPHRLSLFTKQYKINATADNAEIVKGSDVVILSVKPQMMAAVLEPLRGQFRAEQLVISIAAGIRTEKLDEACKKVPAIVRVMPNTPALVAMGVSAICSGPRSKNDHIMLAESLFASVGSTLRVREEQMDAVTAVSGSGPAYVFYLMEAMLDAAQQQGFTEEIARQLVYETVKGAAALADQSEETPEVLRARVTSKGGTTEAAIRVLNEHSMSEVVVKAIDAAARRSKELSSN